MVRISTFEPQRTRHKSYFILNDPFDKALERNYYPVKKVTIGALLIFSKEFAYVIVKFPSRLANDLS